jgi:Uma2 family endonuclease
MASQPRALYTPDDYLALERDSETKHEFFAGEVYAMGGASRPHNIVVVNTAGELRAQLKNGPCQVYCNDMRVKVTPTGLYTYPDVLVVCEEPRFEDHHVDTLLNPKVIFEVLSDSTEAYDRGKKFEHYRRLRSLTDYVLIAQDRPLVEQFVRQPDEHWLLSSWSDLQDSFRIDSIGCELALAEIYDKVAFPSESS